MRLGARDECLTHNQSYLDLVIERVGLDRAARRRISRVEVDNKRFLVLRSGEGLSVLVDEGEFGSSLSRRTRREQRCESIDKKRTNIGTE